MTLGRWLLSSCCVVLSVRFLSSSWSQDASATFHAGRRRKERKEGKSPNVPRDPDQLPAGTHRSAPTLTGTQLRGGPSGPALVGARPP